MLVADLVMKPKPWALAIFPWGSMRKNPRSARRAGWVRTPREGEQWIDRERGC